MYNFIEDIERKGIELGIELGKKMLIYDAFVRGIEIDVLCRFASLPASEILKIIIEMKQGQPSNGVN